MNKLTNASDNIAAIITVSYFTYCVYKLGKFAVDWSVEAGRAHLKTCDCKK